jgi:hypothetical protein
MYVEALEATIDRDIIELLANHYGDGSVYLPVGAATEVLSIAIENDYISEEGYLTRKGRRFVSQYRSDR